MAGVVHRSLLVWLPVVLAVVALACRGDDGAGAAGGAGGASTPNDASHGGSGGADSAVGSVGCTRDTQCKGDRVCEDGKCVDPTDTGGSGGTGLAGSGGTGGTGGAGGDQTDASTLPSTDAGEDVIQTPETVNIVQWAAHDWIRCICKDRSDIQTCREDVECGNGIAQEAACVDVCAGHRGTQGTACIKDHRNCDTPRLEGPDEITCACTDGSVRTNCADLSCFMPDQQLAVCNALCEESGGGAAPVACTDWSESCRPAGTTWLECTCARGKAEVCLDIGCGDDGLLMEEACGVPCDTLGGVTALNCLLNAPDCQ